MTPASRERRQVEVPVFAVTALAWVILIVKPGGSALAGSCCTPESLRDALTPMSIGMLMARNPVSTLAIGWLLMLASMMAPMLADPIRQVLDRSLARRRPRAILLFLAGYVALWMFAGALILPVALAVRLFEPKTIMPAIIIAGIALLWQCSPWKQKCLNRAHVHPDLAAFGAKADIDALRFGLTHGLWCVGSCWALMLLAEVFSVDHLVAMAVVTAWVYAEHLDRPSTPRWRIRRNEKAMRLVVGQARMLLQRA